MLRTDRYALLSRGMMSFFEGSLAHTDSPSRLLMCIFDMVFLKAEISSCCSIEKRGGHYIAKNASLHCSNGMEAHARSIMLFGWMKTQGNKVSH